MSVMFDCTACGSAEQQNRCKALRKAYEMLGDLNMCKFTSWPGGQSKTKGKADDTSNLHLAGYIRHLKNGGPKNPRSKISLVHWHPKVVHFSFGIDGKGKLPQYLTQQLGKEVELSDADLVSHKSSTNRTVRDANYYYNFTTTTTHLAGIWGRKKSSIGNYIYEWAPKWGKMGRYLSVLDVTQELLKACTPKEFKVMQMEKVGLLVDGKVIMTEVCRAHSAVKRAMWNDKTNHDGVLFHAWIIPYGLSVEHTPLYLGRVTEQALVELWGSGNTHALQSV